MAELQICFGDGAAYERMMGAWSRLLAGEIFLDWLSPRSDLRWRLVGRRHIGGVRPSLP